MRESSSLREYIIKRILIAIFILFVVGFIIYALMRALPTSYIETVARERAAQGTGMSFDQWMEQLRQVYNYDRNVFEGYLGWVGNIFKGDFGDSWLYGIPVVEKFKDVIWYSVVLTLITSILQILISIPLGIKSAVNQYTWKDYTITVISLLGVSVPTFFFATILKFVFSQKLGWFDLYGMVGRNHMQLSPFMKFLDYGYHLVLPVFTLVFISIGGITRYTRTNMLEVLNSDYIRTARSKGLDEKTVINHHAFRNTLLPLITILGGTLPGLFSGSMITETLFQIPGIGYTSYQAMVAGDIPFTMFYMLFLAVLTLAGTLIADIMYAVADPRVRVG